MKLRVLVPVVVLLFAGLSGCIGGVKYEYVTVTKGFTTATGGFNGTIPEGKGVLEGQVLTEDGLPIRAAHVAILGGREFTESDRKGRFLFAGLEPDDYTIRVDRDGYLGAQHGVAVLAGKVVFAEIVLTPSNAVVPGQREHIHDLWEGAPDKLLFDRDVPFRMTTDSRKTPFATGVCVGTAGTGNNPNQQECYSAPFHLPEGKVVPPWTTKLRFTFSWTDPAIPTVDLRYRNLTYRTPTPLIQGIPNGGTVEVGVNETTADHGHARWTSWSFTLRARPELVRGQTGTAHSTDWTNDDHGPIRVKIVAVRGDPYPERKHERYWSNGSRLVLLPEEEHSHGAIGHDPNAPIASSYSCGNGASCFQPKKVVPPGTTRLIVTLTYKPSTDGWPVNNDKGIAMRTAKINPFTATWDDLRVEDYVTKAGNTYTFEYKLMPDETDPYYARVSNFVFLPNPKGAERDPNVQSDCGTGCGGDRYKMSIEAVNDNWRPEYATGGVEA